MSLDRYNEKRDFKKTPEPAGSVVKNKGALRFVIQKHAATRLHYDFRLELGGVLLSWAVPKGPSLDPADKRLAVHVEDHPVQYGSFEGIIPHGEYGGGSVVVWDRGHWYPEGDAEKDYARGNLKFRLDGEKCQGSFALVRMHGPRSDDGKNWLLLKHADEHASEDGELLVRDRPESVQTGRTVEEVAAAPDKAWHSNRGGQKGGEKLLSAAESKSLAIAPKAPRKPAAAAPELDSEDVARRRLGLPAPAARTAKTARKATAKKTTKAATPKQTAAKTTEAAAPKKTAAKTTTKATGKTAAKTTTKATGKTAADKTAKATGKTATKKLAKATGKTAADKTAKATGKTAANKTAKATGKTAADKTAKVTGKTATKKLAKATGKTAARKVGKAAARHASSTRAAEEPAPPVRATPRERLGQSHLPEQIVPELATLVEAVPPGPEWLHEIKYDGYRLVARMDGDRIALLTRGGEDWSSKFPWLVEALRARVDVGQAILDGELVHLGSDGVTRFGELQKALSDGRHESLVYFVFDVLHLQGLDLRDLPLDQRKQALGDLLPPEKKPGRVRLSEHIIGQGEPLITRACKIGLEGVISKRRNAPYKSGRHRDWLKIKCGKRQEVVVGGFTPARSGNRDIGSLLLGLYDDAGDFIYCGKVGSGFDFSGATRLRARLDKLVTRQSPFSKMPSGFSRNTFVRPEIVVEVSFAEWTSDGRMRHPVFEGVREDKPAKAIRRENSMPVAKAVAAVSATAPARTTAKKVLVSKPPSPPSKRRSDEIDVLGVRISHPTRVLYPADGITKRDIAEYYAATAEWMMPWTAHRPLSVVRCPDSIDKPCFFQKHIHHELPPGIATADLDGEGGEAPSIYVDTAQGLVGLTQVGTLEVHIWGSTIERPEDPDRFIIDLDPDETVPWARVKETAAAVRTRLEDLDLTSFLKTTGGKGLHVVVPLTPGKQDWDTVKAFTHGIALEFARAAPDLFTATATKAKRTGRIYMDYLRNYRGSTSVAPYSTRSRPGAPVSVPLRWDELAALESSYKYTIKNLAARLKSLKADPWKDMARTKQHLRPEVLRAVIKR